MEGVGGVLAAMERGLLMDVSRGTPRKTKCCSGCKGDRDRPGQALCRKCHREYMRTWRSEHVYVKRAEA
jgi:hypothetical protein